MADIKTANLAKLVTKQAGRAKEKVRPNCLFWAELGLFLAHVWYLSLKYAYVGFMHCLRFFYKCKKLVIF